ncbi:MAG TPA: aryl-sulfate sulfotransferase [Candidatus Thermoplasmatota archaeon]|nr:aryl-sulfate sulfotransferase [Candidatus Thermoplasmatota archaeon]
MNRKPITGCVLIILLLGTVPLTFAHPMGPATSETLKADAGSSLKGNATCDGYTLFGVITLNMDDYFPLLIDMKGNEIKRWNATPDPAKMLPGGSIIAATGDYYKEADNTNLSQLDWNGTIVWDFSHWVQVNGQWMAREHHDFQREGNPVGYYAPGQDFVPQGKTLVLAHQTLINRNVSWRPIIDDVIYEVNWNGTLTGFEWHASDHIDEMGFDANARFSIWLRPGGPGILIGCVPGDWLHLNTIALLGENKWYDQGDERFNPNNIMICSRQASFIAIVSRETGKIVWRYGPDFPSSDNGSKVGRLIGPHDAHLIPKGLPGEGNLLIFDNGGIAGYGTFGLSRYYRFYSRVVEFNPITFDVAQEYSHRTGFYPYPRSGDYHHLFSFTMCSVQRLPNGNTLVSEGLSGRIFELSPTNQIVWQYVYPDPHYVIYRAYRIPPEWVPGNPAGYPSWEG